MAQKPIFDKPNILVTGGAGFIGSHLCDQLVRTGARVICIDNFSTGIERNIDLLLKNPDFQFLKIDISQPFDLENFPELEAFKIPFQGIQEIYHLACPTAVKRFDAFKLKTLQTNSRGTLNIFDLGVKYESRVVYASSSVVYGSRSEGDLYFDEEKEGSVDHLLPRAAYDEGKRFGETCAMIYKQTEDLDVRIGRLFRTYGPRMPLFDGHLIPDFIMNALDGKPLVIYGDEHYKTSLCFVQDIVDGLIRLARTDGVEGPVNLGSDVDLKLVDVANTILKLTDSQSQIVFEPPLPFLTELGLPRITKAKEELGWLPLSPLEVGLQKTVDDVRANRILLTDTWKGREQGS